MKLILTFPKILLLLTQVTESLSASRLSTIAGDVASSEQVKDNNGFDWRNHDVFSKTSALDGDATMSNASKGLRNLRDLSDSIHRKLNDDLIPCNSVIDVMPLAIVQAMVTGAFSYKFEAYTAGPPLVEAQLMVGERVPSMEHDVQMMKVCGSCESEGINGYGCAADDYGYDTQHSGVLLLPVKIDEESSEVSIIDSADELQAYIGMRSIAITPKDSAVLLYTNGATVLEFAMYAASMGLVSILPHLMGFGESAKAGAGGGPLIPSIVDKKAKTTATLPLYAKAKSIVDEMSGGMTTVGNEAYFMGYSEGGNSAIGAADGFEKNGITPVKVMAGGAPLMIRSTSMLSLIQSLLAAASDPLSVDPFDILYTALVGVAFSDTRPGPANFGQGQPFLNEESAQGYAALFTDKDAPAIYGENEGEEAYFAYLQTNYLQLISNPNFLSTNFITFFALAIGNGDPDPCMNVPLEQQVLFEVDKICATLNENDLTDVVRNSSYKLELCQAEDDTLVLPESVPDASKLKFSVPGDHLEGNNPCSTKFIYGTIFEKPNIREENNSNPTQSPNITKAPNSDKKTKSSKAPKSGKKSKAPKALKSGKKSKTPKAPKSGKKSKAPNDSN